MKWNVYRYNINKKKIEVWNVFDHGGFKEGIDNLLTKELTREEFEKELKRSLMYYFWCKCEHEVIVGPWIGNLEKEGVKVDIYEQIRMNWDLFVEYVWGQKDGNSWKLYDQKKPPIDTPDLLVTTTKGRVFMLDYGIANEGEEPSFYKWDDEYCTCYKPNVVAWKYPCPYKNN